jgi:hypothetical protein
LTGEQENPSESRRPRADAYLGGVLNRYDRLLIARARGEPRDVTSLSLSVCLAFSSLARSRAGTNVPVLVRAPASLFTV